MSSHLSSEELDQIRSKLQQRFEHLSSEIHDHLMNSGVDTYVELAGKVHDRGEESVAELLADLSYNVTEVHIKELQAIEKALATIHGGKYGRCIDCDVDIPFKRLLVEPATSRCLSCQEAFEENKR